ncbi:hypothetical protein Tco_0218764 [Tanacetum coccineum]
MFIKYSTGQIPPKKSRGKVLQGKKTTYTPVTDDDMYEESEPEPAKKKTSRKRRIKKKPTRRRKSGNVTFNPPKKLKGVPFLTLKEQEAANTIQALKESRKTSRRQPSTGGSNEGTGTIPGVPDKSIVVSTTSSEGTEEDQLGDEEKDDKDDDADDKGDDYISDNQDADDEDAETESDKDEIYKYKICVRKDKDVEMSNVEVEDSDKGDEEVTDAAKSDAEKTSELVLLRIPEINSLMEVKIQSEVPHIQSPSMLRVLVSVISKPSVLTPVQESPLMATVTTLPPPSSLKFHISSFKFIFS